MNGQTVLGFNSNVTFRDYFAKEALGVLIGASIYSEVVVLTPDEIAREAYAYADAMIKESNK